MFKNENGFSLVELAIAAGLAVALAATAVTILSGTTATLSSNANGAAGTSSQYNTDVLANASGTAGSNTGGNNAPVVTAASLVGSATFPSWSTMYGYGWSATWTEATPVLVLETTNGTPTSYYYDAAGSEGMKIPTTRAHWEARGEVCASDTQCGAYTLTNGSWIQTSENYAGQATRQGIYNVDANGNVIPF